MAGYDDDYDVPLPLPPYPKWQGPYKQYKVGDKVLTQVAGGQLWCIIEAKRNHASSAPLRPELPNMIAQSDKKYWTYYGMDFGRMCFDAKTHRRYVNPRAIRPAPILDNIFGL